MAKVPEYSALTEDFTHKTTLPDNAGKDGMLGVQSNPGKECATGKKRKKGKTGHVGNMSNRIVKSYKLPANLVLSIERVAYWQRRKIQDVVAYALEGYLQSIPEDDKKPMPNESPEYDNE